MTIQHQITALAQELECAKVSIAAHECALAEIAASFEILERRLNVLTRTLVDRVGVVLVSAAEEAE